MTRPPERPRIGSLIQPKTHCLLNLQRTVRLPEQEKRRVMPKSILTISRNKELQHVRTLVLQHAGYEVSEAINDKDALAFMDAPNSFSLVLLCHSVPELSRVRLVTAMKAQQPHLPVLMLYNGHDPTAARVDGSIHNLDSAENLLEMIGFLTKPVRTGTR